MKSFLLLLSLLLLVTAVFATEIVKLTDADNSVSVLSSTAAETVLEYSISHFERIPVTIGGSLWYQIRLPKEGITQELGEPELPVFNRSIIIPDNALMCLQVYDIQYQDLELPVAPSRGIITRDQDPDLIPYTFGDIYKSGGFHPSDIAELSDPYILRDWRGITVRTIPFAYSPLTKTLRIYTSYKIRVYSDGWDSLNAYSGTRNTISRAFLPIYENHFINWQDFRYVPVDDSFGKLIVVCHTNYMAAILPYVNWKRQKGVETELVEWSSIGTTAAQLQTYIQNRYNADNTITYIQIVGDAPQIPSLSSGGGGSDPSFSLVAGGDNYPDIFIGRFSAETVDQVTAQINKAIVYERDANTSATWLSRAMGIASAEGGGSLGDMGESDIQHMNLIRTDLLNYGYTVVDQIYDPGATAAQVTTGINAGRGFVNYVGHGSNTAWSTTGFNNTNASALTNGYMTPIIQDVACVNGNFVSITCFAEAWLRNANGGAVAMYASSINQSWNSPMRAQDETVDLLVAEAKFTTGGLFYNGSCKMMDVYGNTTGSDGVNMFKTWHIFGDAALSVRSKTPLAMTVTHPAQIIIGATTVNVSTGVANSLVALTYNNTIYARGYTNSAGNATLSLVNPPTTAINYTITATALNRVTYVGTIQQIPGTGPYVVVAAADYADSNNNLPEYNESGGFNVSFENIGATLAENITATLTCSTPGINITDNTQFIASLAAGATTTINNAFSINIAADIEHGTLAQFTITMVSGSEVWTHNFSLQLNAPLLSLGSMLILDPSGNNNGQLDPGETATITILLENNGGAASPSGTATLSCLTPGITINTPVANFTSINSTASTELSFSISAAPSLIAGTPAELVFAATAGAYGTDYEQTISVGTPPTVVIGNGTSATPTTAGAPINIYYKSLHGQSVYTAAELNAAGVYGPVTITEVGFYISSVPNLALPNFIIRMKHTTSTNVSSWITSTGMATVYSATSYMPVAGGYEMLTLSTPFEWNGNDNIVIDTAFGLVSDWSSTGTVQYTSVTNGYRYVRSDTANQTNVFTGGSTSSYRPNVTLTFQAPAPDAPYITVNPAALTEFVDSGFSTTSNLTIGNSGQQTLTWSLQGRETSTPSMETGFAQAPLETGRVAPWYSSNLTSGTILPGGSTTLQITFDSTGLADGTYTDTMVILSDAVNNPALNVPISLTVTTPMNPYPTAPRYVAEWEPAKGAVIRYPVGLPYSLIADLSNQGLLYVVVTTANQSACNSALTSNGVNMPNVRYINAASDSYWIRDYGPWTIFEEGTQMKIVDFTYNRPRPNDNLIPTVIANYLGIQYYTMPLTHTGGNLMTDGQGKAMSTNLVLEENPTLNQNQVNQMFSSYLGVDEYQLYPDPNNTYIDHIDCWAKLLDVDKVMIRSVPTSHPQYSAIEAVVALWQTKTSSYGTPYRIFRVYTPNNEPYSNSFILNQRVYVPQMGGVSAAYDVQALTAYQNAMPGYTIVGYSYSNFASTDAIHCRVNTVFDDQMVMLAHTPPASLTALSAVTLDVEITHTNAIDPANSYIAYRYALTGDWQYANLSFQEGRAWSATIPVPPLGETLYYYVKATDVTDRHTTLPLCAANDPFALVVDVPAGNTAPTIELPASFSFDQNGSLSVDFSAYVADADGDPLTLSCSGNTSVIVEIVGLNVTFSAPVDWIGSEEITFTVSDGLDESSDLTLVTVNLVYLATPLVQLELTGSAAVLSWNAIPNAQAYRIYACDSPDGTFTLVGTTSDLSWSDPAAPAPEQRFYKVKAVTLDK